MAARRSRTIACCKRFRGHTHVRLKLESGRTHQIRVHMAHIRYPLVGDRVYGGRLLLPKGASPQLIEALRALQTTGAACRESRVRSSGE